MDYDSDHASDYELKPLQFTEDEADTAASRMRVIKGVADAYIKLEDNVKVKEDDEGQDKVWREEKGQFEYKIKEENVGNEVDEVRHEEKGKQEYEIGEEDEGEGENSGKGKEKVRGKKQKLVYRSATPSSSHISLSDSSSCPSTTESTNEVAEFWFCPRKGSGS